MLRTPFSGKLALLLIGITVVVMSGFILVRVYFFNQLMAEDLNNKAVNLAKRISNTVNPSIWNIYSKSLERKYSAQFASTVLDTELLDPNLIGIRVYGNFGHLYMGKVKLDGGSIIQYSKDLHNTYLSQIILPDKEWLNDNRPC